MKKLVAILLVLTLFAVSALAEETGKSVRQIGQLAKSNYTEEEFNQLMSEEVLPGSWYVFDDGHETHYKFFDDLSSMLMALKSGVVDEITLPQYVAEYVVSVNPELEVTCAQSLENNMSLLFGFRDDEAGRDLQARLNEAIDGLQADGTLDTLKERYLNLSNGTELLPVAFESFPDSDETIRVVVTGDLPPIDYIEADGTPAGFNTAVLAEIGRWLEVNIELVSMQTGSRAMALTSNAADAVFWFMDRPGHDDDAPEGLVFSKPYLDWNLWLHIQVTDEPDEEVFEDTAEEVSGEQ